MKLPNGYGTVYKLTGNRRRPWVVKKTIDGRQKPLGYFTTREEAFAFLVSVNHMTPGKEITFSDHCRIGSLENLFQLVHQYESGSLPHRQLRNPGGVQKVIIIKITAA